MKKAIGQAIGLVFLFCQGIAWAGETALTIYNQEFAVIRELVPLDLKNGVNKVDFNEITAHLEPDSVMLRDPSGKRQLQILEQNYRNDPVSQELLLSLFEGKSIEFLAGTNIVQGKIVRSGYALHQSALQRYSRDYYNQQMAYYGGSAGQPVVEVEGKVRFGLPGQPLFPSLTDVTILKPTIYWLIASDKAGKIDAELCYVTGGMRWDAAYNMVLPEAGDMLDLVGWITMDNQSGRTFENAKIKLMAGDVSKIKPQEGRRDESMLRAFQAPGSAGQPPVTEKAFDEYHLYTLERSTTLYDRETKQVEFVRAAGVKSQGFYVYDGVQIDNQRYQGWRLENIRQEQGYGTQSNPKVWAMREFANKADNHLGLPLPKGKIRFYRRDAENRIEFTGENIIDHTPRDEMVRVYVGNAFDLVGERRQTNYKIDTNKNYIDEAFEIKLRNRKKDAVEIRVVEHLYRWITWEILQASNTYLKTDARTVEFRIEVLPDEEKTINYSVHYTW